MRVNVVRVGRLPRLELAAHLDEVRRDGGGQLDDGFIPGGRALLRQVAQRDAALEIDLPIIRRVGLEDEREERGLARAVRSDQADAVAAVHLEGHVTEERAATEGLGDF